MLEDRAFGDPAAPVTIVYYGSVGAPLEAVFLGETLPILRARYIDTGKVRLIYREFPLEDLSLAAFMTARCLPEAAYFPMLTDLATRRDQWLGDPLGVREALQRMAARHGMTSDRFEACLADADGAFALIDMRERAMRLHVDSVSSAFVNGRLLKRAFGIDDLSALIEEELAN